MKGFAKVEVRSWVGWLDECNEENIVEENIVLSLIKWDNWDLVKY